MITYKHKTLPYIAKEDEDNKTQWYRLWFVENWRVLSHKWMSTDYSKDWRIIERYTIIPKKIIENSNDWDVIYDQKELNGYIWKTIWFQEPNTDDAPMKWKIIAIDMYNRPICEYDELEWDVFCDTPIEQLFFKEPKKVIEIEWKKYIELD